MRIVIMEDEYADVAGDAHSKDEVFAQRLLLDKHTPYVFNGLKVDKYGPRGTTTVKSWEPKQATVDEFVAWMATIAKNQSTIGLVIDLIVIDDQDYGKKVWDKVNTENAIDCSVHAIVLSKLVGATNREGYALDFRIPVERIFGRMTTSPDTIAQQFSEED